MKKIAFVTSQEDPGLISDDRLALPFLETLGYSVSPLVWDSSHLPITSFDGLIFRSCWNYHRKFSEFQRWLETAQSSGVPTFNSFEMMKWNLNKSYLLDLANWGAPVPRTTLIAQGSRVSRNELKNRLESISAIEVVIKPAISLNGHDTHLLPGEDLKKIEEVIKEISSTRDVLIQEYIPEITSSGEISLIFFNGEFSHSIRKTPAKGEFRVQVEYGGTRTPIISSDDLISQANSILKMAGETLLFARVDLVETNRGPFIIEFEIIDPMLFLGSSEGAPERFAKAIAQRLN